MIFRHAATHSVSLYKDDGGRRAVMYVGKPCMCKATCKSACYVQICVIVTGTWFIYRYICKLLFSSHTTKGDLRLVGGGSDSRDVWRSIYHRGRWGTDVQRVYHRLGYTYGGTTSAHGQAIFGQSSGPCECHHDILCSILLGCHQSQWCFLSFDQNYSWQCCWHRRHITPSGVQWKVSVWAQKLC